MDVKNDMENIDDMMMPGFRFHPTDEELVSFYLKRKIQQKSLPIELIKQLDIYKHDPWDLPKLASSGEKEWYFYCPRFRKYRNSARPNRVTRTGFWKATGTDRPIYSSEGKCIIGLKKSLVFYRGRASKGIKTDWMMHEFRLPCISDSSTPPKSFSEKSITARDSWAICRIFKKTSSISMAQKALSQSWFSHLPTTMVSDTLTQGGANFNLNNQFTISDNNISSYKTSSEIASSTIQQFQHQQQELHQLSASDIPSYKPIISNNITNPSTDDNSFMFYSFETIGPTNPIDCIGFEDTYNQHYSNSIDLQTNMPSPVQFNGFPFHLIPNNDDPIFPWDSNPCPNDISTNKCYTIS